ncbi:MAG: class I SAM-dependent methyltransferase [Bdellovibrionota bacterium]
MHLTALAQHTIESRCPHASIAVDATVGNGKDALFLAKRAEELFCFDIQPQAIANAKQAMQDIGSDCQIHWIQASHAYMDAYVHGKIDICMFNLGYLPGGDQNITTHSASTIKALNIAIKKLHPEGVLSILCYPGHPAGMIEYETIQKWLAAHTDKCILKTTQNRSSDPVLYILQQLK